MALDRTPFDALVQSSGDPTHGSVWGKPQIEDVILDPVDAEIARLDAAIAAGGGTAVAVSAYANAIQSVANAVWTALNFQAEDFDASAMHDNATNNGRITIPAGQGGTYLVIASGYFAAHVTGSRGLRILRNGAALTYNFIPTTGGNYASIPVLPLLAALVAGDYLTVEAFQDSGAAMNVGSAVREFTNWFVAVKVT